MLKRFSEVAYQYRYQYRYQLLSVPRYFVGRRLLAEDKNSHSSFNVRRNRFFFNFCNGTILILLLRRTHGFGNVH